ncbi:lysophospholipid acyltransferase family protein [Kineosporia sp. NBRC 101731]|uniref:lysophospholipid acyltransferase family protein n=1 Tax=Kineosporia sp. NBRC 101731 TaxID=3032199 RepID=UPI0024A5D222|nr:lysophospholipid acyltransferase family protein [Kineosporia sp. NBRC 101731]GLY28599.1 1-acyl-sn-glycerol-3-phosphate acyltransferase [Kineosporia sp. NBRC 101731]
MVFRVLKAVLAPFVWLFGRPVVTGREYLPRKGPVILAGNHLSFSDSLFLILVARRRVTFLAKSEYFTRGRLQRWFFTCAGQIPVDRANPARAASSLDQAVKILADGGVWGIFPEGTRSPDGRLHRGRTGAVRVALATGAPIVPVVLRGTDRVNPPGSRIWRPGRVCIEFCPPMDLSGAKGPDRDGRTVRQLTDDLMGVLAAHSGQEYVDVYATAVKKAVG